MTMNMILMSRGWMLALIFFAGLFDSRAQELILPGIQGEELVIQLRDAYRPAFVLNSSESKDTLYAVVQNEDDTVRCVYSGHYLVLPDAVDPSQWLFMDGETEGINLEHVYPVSKGAHDWTQGHTDMHHLFPTRVKVNSDRASFPFGEIPDAQTLRWYYKTDVMGTIPPINIDQYSEWNNALFEPREDFKGDVARAVMYFFTMYRDDAMAADPDFFEQQRLTLLEWHATDPADPFERLRNERVAQYQDGKKNPYILDPTLAVRAFCQPGEACNLVGTADLKGNRGLMDVHFGTGCTLFFHQPVSGEINVLVSDLSGKSLLNQKASLSGEEIFVLPFQADVNGLYLVRVVTEDWQWAGIAPSFQ